MPSLSYKDKYHNKMRNFEDKDDEFIASIKSKYDNIFEAAWDFFTSEFPLPDASLQLLREEKTQWVTGYNLDRGFVRVTVNPDEPTSSPAKVKINLQNFKANKSIINFTNALKETINGQERTVYVLPGALVLLLRKDFVEADPDNVEKFLKDNDLGDPITTNFTPGLLQLRLPRGMTLESTLAKFNDPAMDSKVVCAEPAYIGVDRETLVTPNEAYYSSDLWGVKKIQTVNAWNHTKMGSGGKTGVDKVIIAVIDTGVRNKHDDLGDYLTGLPTTKCLLKKNLGEDWDFTDGGDDNPDDESPDGHGTNVIGVIGAYSPNAMGTVGVAPGCKVMPLRVDLGINMGGTYADRADAINYASSVAEENTTKRYIINLSWKMTTDSAVVHSAIQNATGVAGAPNPNTTNPVVVIAAAGDSTSGVNIGTSPVYPASYPEVIAVAGSTQTDGRVSTSNYGTNVIYAPGTSIYTTHNGSTSSYCTTVGTSMSAAFVSGVAALIYTANYYKNGGAFTLNAAGVKTVLTAAGSLDPLTGGAVGRGRINAKKCLDHASV